MSSSVGGGGRCCECGGGGVGVVLEGERLDGKLLLSGFGYQCIAPSGGK